MRPVPGGGGARRALVAAPLRAWAGGRLRLDMRRGARPAQRARAQVASPADRRRRSFLAFLSLVVMRVVIVARRRRRHLRGACWASPLSCCSPPSSAAARSRRTWRRGCAQGLRRRGRLQVRATEGAVEGEMKTLLGARTGALGRGAHSASCPQPSAPLTTPHARHPCGPRAQCGLQAATPESPERMGEA